jgi:hypothetical protein
MSGPTEFYYSGLYRVQSRKKMGPAEIRGNWLEGFDTILDSTRVNAELRADPRAIWHRPIDLKVADIRQRTGMFEVEPDILYKKDFFEPDQGREPLPCNVVDAGKSLLFWQKRWPYIEALFGSAANELSTLIPDLIAVIANEYYCHEAGHSLGYAVEAKYADGYFRPGKRTAWPLIWIEEFRADLHSFGYAIRMLSERQAVAVFAYNLLLRLGLECSSVRDSTDGYGAVPFLLYSTLCDLGLLSVVRTHGHTALALSSLNPQYLVEIMKQCDRHADESFTSIELSSMDYIDGALSAATYYRERLSNQNYLSEYREAMQCASQIVLS